MIDQNKKTQMLYTDEIINALFHFLSWFQRYKDFMPDDVRESAPRMMAGSAIGEVLAGIIEREGEDGLRDRHLTISHAQLAELCMSIHEFIDNHSINNARHACSDADTSAIAIEDILTNIGFYGRNSGEPVYIRQVGAGALTLNPLFQ